jgi:hypothetical protein
MKCPCGHLFHCLSRSEKPDYLSFALIDDRDYPAFLRYEMRVLAAPTRTEKLAAIARTVPFVGTILECPCCSRLLVLRPTGRPGADELQVYALESRIPASPAAKPRAARSPRKK